MRVVVLALLVALCPVLVSAQTRVHLVPIAFDQEAPWTSQEGLQLSADRNAAFWNSVSYGALTLSVVVHDVVRVPRPASGCPFQLIGQQAMAALSARGDGIPGTEFRQFWFPSLPCPWGGNTTIDGLDSYINQAPSLSAHEFGHSFGFGHSEGQQVNGVSVGYQPYGGNSVMGGGDHLDAAMKDWKGWLPNAVQAVTASGMYHVQWLQPTPLAGVRALKVRGRQVIQFTPSYHCYYVEARQGAGVLVWQAICDPDGAVSGYPAIQMDLDSTAVTDYVLDPGQSYTARHREGMADGVTFRTISFDQFGAVIGAQFSDEPSPAINLRAM